MFGFFLKKNFCDVWDNMFHLAILNLFLLACIAAGVAFIIFSVYIPGPENIKVLYQVAAFFIVCAILGVLVFAEGENAAKIANFGTSKLKEYFSNIPSCIKDGAAFGLFVGLLAAVSVVSIPFYYRIWIPADGSQGSYLGLILLSIVFWGVVITVMALQWFLPIRSLMHNPFVKCLKKSYILFFDNASFTLALLLSNVVRLIISVFTLGLIPSLNGITLANTNALRLRLYKYDWIEVNPGLTKEQLKQVPWDELIQNDKNILGPRKLKSFFFPWKE
ncbi:MAG TPA: hypothetical protein DCQ43_03115 [Treponema sp.]|nr:hypothetical protein [Treponema sp.]